MRRQRLQGSVYNQTAMRKIVIASNAFKGSLSSSEVARSAERGIRMVCPDCHVVRVAVADGGSGTAEAMVDAMSGEKVSVTVHDPLMRRVEAIYGIVNNGKTAVIEMAQASGLALVPPDRRNPMETTSYGTGELIVDALERGCREFIVGLGDSATNDAGMGMLQSLGVRFYDDAGTELRQGGAMLSRVNTIDVSGMHKAVSESSFRIASDVNAPLYGRCGAAYVFAPQKGATPEMVETLDDALKSFSDVVNTFTGSDKSQTAGAGAAGGLGFAFASFMSSEIVSGVNMVLDAIGFDKLIEGADMVITGEGRLDMQTISGKTPSAVLAAAKRKKIPVVAICGSVEHSDALNEHGFTAIFPILSALVPVEKAMERDYAMENISRTVSQIMRIKIG